MDALLVVDMQNACIDEVQRHDPEWIIASINELIRHFRDSQKPVIFIQHEDPSPEFRRGSDGWQISPRMDLQSCDRVVAKTYNDAFINTELLSLLQQYDVDRLVITGCATDFCVDATVKGAISHRFNIVVAADGHTTAERPHVSAANLIAHFNWNWANLSSGDKAIEVLPATEIIARLSHA